MFRSWNLLGVWQKKVKNSSEILTFAILSLTKSLNQSQFLQNCKFAIWVDFPKENRHSKPGFCQQGISFADSLLKYKIITTLWFCTCSFHLASRLHTAVLAVLLAKTLRVKDLPKMHFRASGSLVRGLVQNPVRTFLPKPPCVKAIAWFLKENFNTVRPSLLRPARPF